MTTLPLPWQVRRKPLQARCGGRLEGNALFKLIAVIALLKQRGLLEKLGLKD